MEYGHEMRIGGTGTGSLIIENGARVFDAGPDFNGNAPATAIGVGSGGSGSVRVDSSGFTGNTNLTGGNLIVNGTLGGVIVVQESGLLGGTGIVGSAAIDTGGILSPGNSIGALHVNRNLAFN